MQDEVFLNAQSIEEFSRLLAQTCDIGLNFKLRRQVFGQKSMTDILASLIEPLPRSGLPIETVLDVACRDVVEPSTNFSSIGYMGFPDYSGCISPLMGSVLGDLLNQNLINSTRWSPSGTAVEVATVRWLRELLGYAVPDLSDSVYTVGGFATSGGVLSNAVGLLLAREQIYQNCLDEGLPAYRSQFKVLAPAGIDHYSIRAALGWLGIGRKNLVLVRSTNYKMDPDDLQGCISHCRKSGVGILAIVAYAGDSRTLTVDSLNDLADVCEREQIWFHVDACHGFQLAFSDRLRPRLHGINRADSVAVDPHKVLFVPHVLSYVLVKEPGVFRLLEGGSDLVTTDALSLGAITPFLGTKNFGSLKLWFLMKHLGVQAIGQLIEARHKCAVRLCEILSRDSRFVVLNPDVHINSVMFMYIGSQGIDSVRGNSTSVARLNAVNLKIHNELISENEFYVHTFGIPDANNEFSCSTELMLQPLRYMSGNPNVLESDLEGLVNRIATIGSRLL